MLSTHVVLLGVQFHLADAAIERSLGDSKREVRTPNSQVLRIHNSRSSLKRLVSASSSTSPPLNGTLDMASALTPPRTVRKLIVRC